MLAFVTSSQEDLYCKFKKLYMWRHCALGGDNRVSKGNTFNRSAESRSFSASSQSLLETGGCNGDCNMYETSVSFGSGCECSGSSAIVPSLGRITLDVIPGGRLAARYSTRQYGEADTVEIVRQIHNALRF